MTDKLILIGLIICFSCADKKEESKPDIGQSKAETPNDTFKIAGQVVLKEYVGEGGRLVTEEEKTIFETVDHEDILVQAKLRTINPRVVDKPDYKLNLKLFKTSLKKYDKLMWEINTEGQTPEGIWGVFKKFYKTSDTGCCSEEDGYRLYDLETGKEFLSFSGELKYTHYPTWNYTGYQAGAATTFDIKSLKEIIGNLYYIEIDANSDKTDLSRYDVLCNACLGDVRFEHTPEFEIKPKGLLKDEGFFHSYNLYQNGESLTQLDTADYYLTLKYDTRLVVLVPLVEKGLILSGQLSTDRELSKDLKIKSR